MTLFQFCQQLQNAVKQHQIMLMGHVMVAITRPQLRVLFHWHIRGGMGQSLHQGHADDIGSRFPRGLLAPHIHHSKLDAPRDDGGRVKQGAVPIKGDQVKLPRALILI